MKAPAERLAMLRVLVGAYAVVYLLARANAIWAATRYPAGQFNPVGFSRLLEAPLPPAAVGLGLALGVAITGVLGVTVPLNHLIYVWVLAPGAGAEAVQPIPDMDQVSNIRALGDILYTKYIFFFQIAGMILLVAMVGAIVLTLRHKPNVRRQDIGRQVARTPETAIEVVKVESGKGI